MSTPFVARAAQVEQLRGAWVRAGSGEPAVVLLGADAGVGKTRLLRHVAALAQAGGALVVTAHCVDLGDVGLPYLPFVEALARLRELDPTAVDAVVASRPALARLLPGQVGGSRDDDPAYPGPDEQSSRMQLFDGVVELLAAVGHPGAPLVLVLEDLHWADPSSRDLLRFVTARLRAEHVLVVASYRTDDLHRRHPWRPVVAELSRHPRVQRIDLPPFTDDEVRAFATAVAGRQLPEPVVRRVIERSEGNAYYAEELLESGADTDGLPWTLADVLRTRLEQLDPAVQQLARVASVAGRRVTEPLLRAAVVASGDPVLNAPGVVDDALREAVTRHVLVGEDEHIAFRHALLAEAVAADLLPGEVSSLHRAYLRALLADPGLGPASVLALHALRAPDLPIALTASLEAARTAFAVLAPAEALHHLETALRLWDAVPDAAALTGCSHVDVLVDAATAASRAGASERAGKHARTAVEESTDPVARAVRRTALARYLLLDERPEDAMAEASRARDDLPPERVRERAWALATYARAALTHDRDGEATTSATEAVELARSVGAADAESDALTTLAVLVVDDAPRAAALLDEALGRARDACDLETELRTRYNLASNRFYAGDLDAAVRLTAAGLARAVETGMSGDPYAVSLRDLATIARYMLGDLTPDPDRPVLPRVDPVDPVDGTRGATGRTSAPGAALDLLTAGARAIDLYAAVARGDTDTVERGRALEPMWQRDGSIALIGGGTTIDALTWRGRDDEAVELALAVIGHLDQRWSDYFLGGIWLAALALGALADAAAAERLLGKDVHGREAQADTLLERAVTTAERGRPRGGPLGPEGRAWLARAHAEHARALGRPAVALWAAATDAFAYGYRYEEARTRWRWAEALLEEGERAAAREQAGRALAEADAMGAAPLAAAVRDLARRGRLDLPGVRVDGPDLLTARESEVLSLVAQGLSNRQIGEALYISGKTVSVHVSNLIAKLGVSGRTEAVTVAHQRGLLGA
ncbi:LuxR family transcriptional regulator [Cellulomonas soli]|uniref:LuxR family transcriptional regulator n=2 Tax=Cellulomonas soli TaxID=931535 RepID=A0A512PFD1_9CELL|nr:DNA-binding CsgD family transcriptional regulator/tetratricopeptide (TPR) repeat protein [Cellulomonas soli]GEP69852.1 LuxR family transcriptional regulator [Cellulomonas soli]